MSSISLSLKMLLAGSALAGLTLLACGGDDSSGGGDKEPTGSSKPDAGKGKDAGTGGKKDSGAIAIPTAVEGEECTGPGGKCDDDECDDAPCFSQCVDGTYDECKSSKDLISLFTDGGGIPNTIKSDGATYTVKDGSVSVMVGDASIDIPATECPDNFACSDLSAFGVPVKYCATGPLPPSCMTTQDCTNMGFKLATCGDLPLLGKACLQICK